jgi:predicted metalloendopeptidase
MNTALDDVPLATWQDYLRWNLAGGFAPYLSSEFVEEDFAFNQSTLQGTEEMKPRWKRVLNVINGNMGEALGQLYVDRAFPPEAKASALEMIGNLQAAVGERIEALDWMGDETRAKALEKLAAFNAKIGYPDEWRDYTALDIGRTNYADNVRQDWQAHRPQRVGDGAASGQRLLHAGDERDRFPGRDPAATLFRPRDRQRRQLRWHGSGHRSRVHARLR